MKEEEKEKMLMHLKNTQKIKLTANIMEHLAAEGQHIFSLEFKRSTKTELERNITEYWRQIIEFLSVFAGCSNR